VALMIGGNAARGYGFDLEALRPVADRIGPTVAEVAQPLAPRSLPIEAESCPGLIGFGDPDRHETDDRQPVSVS
jgi:hypothetical protein